MLHPCPFCELLKNPHDDPTFIAEFEHTVALLNFGQDRYKGQCLLLLKEHYDHLHHVPAALQQAIVPEMTGITRALVDAFGCFRVNHQSLGNQVAHVHWHITPRYPGDENAGGPPVHSPHPRKLADDAYRQLAARIRECL